MPKLKRFWVLVYSLIGLLASFYVADFVWPDRIIDSTHASIHCGGNVINVFSDSSSITCDSGGLVLTFAPKISGSATLIPYLLIGVLLFWLFLAVYPKTRNLKRFKVLVYSLIGLLASFYVADFVWPDRIIDSTHNSMYCGGSAISVSGDHSSIICGSGGLVFTFAPEINSSVTLIPYLLISFLLIGLFIAAYPKTRRWLIGSLVKTSKGKGEQRSNVFLDSVFVKIIPEEFQGELIVLIRQERAKGTSLFRTKIIIWSELIPLLYELVLIKLRKLIKANSKSQGIDD